MWPPLSWRGQRAGDEEWPCRGRRLLGGGRTTLSRVFPHGGGVGWGLAHVVGLFFSGTRNPAAAREPPEALFLPPRSLQQGGGMGTAPLELRVQWGAGSNPHRLFLSVRSQHRAVQVARSRPASGPVGRGRARFLLGEARGPHCSPPADAWTQRWVESKHKPDYGRFVLTAGKFYGDAEKDKGIQTSQDARFYALSSRFEPFSNRDKTLVVQFTVKHEQNIDCGGGYVKLFPAGLSQEDMHGDSEYNIMFGPDICGPGTKKVHVIFNYKGKNVLINKDIRCKDDEFTHLYTLIVRPDNTYEVKIDNSKVESGSLEDDWDFLPPKKIKDPEAKKPEDWDERAKIDDPEDSKPEDWDKPEHIPDPDAKKPEDWDEEMDGEWEPPVIQNPEYKEAERKMKEAQDEEQRKKQEEEDKQRKEEEGDEEGDADDDEEEDDEDEEAEKDEDAGAAPKDEL
uniref:Calreticulin n=1 Tax=Anas platyrhynchos platyrhynchos TaxID=8840 RepID=A0A493TFL0_ANAPP